MYLHGVLCLYLQASGCLEVFLVPFCLCYILKHGHLFQKTTSNKSVMYICLSAIQYNLKFT